MTNTAGTVVLLSGINNTYTGGTTVTNTTLQVTNNNSVGTGTVTLDNAVFQPDGLGGNLTFNNNFKINNSAAGSALDANGVTLTIAGNISDGNGAGKLSVLDSSGGFGTVVLLGTNTYTGGTTICDCATLQLGDATHTASIVGDVFNQGRLFIINANMAGITSITNDASFGFGTGVTAFMGSNAAGTAGSSTSSVAPRSSSIPAAPAAPISRIPWVALRLWSARPFRNRYGRQRNHSEQQRRRDHFLRQDQCRHRDHRQREWRQNVFR